MIPVAAGRGGLRPRLAGRSHRRDPADTRRLPVPLTGPAPSALVQSAPVPDPALRRHSRGAARGPRPAGAAHGRDRRAADLARPDARPAAPLPAGHAPLPPYLPAFAPLRNQTRPPPLHPPHP